MIFPRFFSNSSFKSFPAYHSFLVSLFNFHNITHFSTTPTFDSKSPIARFHKMVQTRLRPSAIEFNNLLTAAVKMEQYSVALHMFDEMLRRNAAADYCTFDIAITCFCRLQRADFGFAVLGSIFKRGYEPSVLTFRDLIHGLLLVGKSLDAATLLKRLLTEEWCKPDANTCLKMITMFSTPDMLSLLEKGRRKPHVYPYNPVIHCLCNDGMVDEALQLISVMNGKGILLDTMIYNSIIEGLCNIRRWDEVEEMLRKMVASKSHPDVYTCNILLDALCKDGMMDAAENIFEMMRKGEMVEAQGLGILRLVVKSDIKPDITSYNILMDGYLKMGRVNEASRIFNEIPTKGLERDVVSYRIMLQALFHEGRCEDGLSLFKEMEALQFPHDLQNYNILLDGLCKARGIAEAFPVFRRMEVKEDRGG